jgi:ribosomal protein S2
VFTSDTRPSAGIEDEGIHLRRAQRYLHPRPGQTLKLFREAEEFVSTLAAEGRTMLFVGTKRQAKDVIAEEAKAAACSS